MQAAFFPSSDVRYQFCFDLNSMVYYSFIDSKFTFLYRIGYLLVNHAFAIPALYWEIYPIR